MLHPGLILSLILLFSCTSPPAPGGNARGGYGDRARPLLVMTDSDEDLQSLRSALADDGWKISGLTQEEHLESGCYLESGDHGALIAYIHQPLNPITEEALISYAESGGKLLVLHHSLASAKTENPGWLKFLGVSLFPGDSVYPWKVTAHTAHTMVNLAPGHYITSNGIEYKSETEFSFSDRPDLEGSFPFFTLPDTEVFHNQRLSGEDEKVILFGYKMTDEAVAGKLQSQGLPIMEPTSGWYKPAGKGWVFYFQAGHGEEDFLNPNFFQVIRNCLQWEPENPEFASAPAREPAFVTLDMNQGESREVKLTDGSMVRIDIETVSHQYDSFRKAVRGTEVKIRVNGQYIVLGSGMYHLPQRISGVQVDCPVTSARINERKDGIFNPWSLEKNVRLRIWPGDSDWIDPDSFSYPVRAAWFSSDTQMTSDPCYVDHAEFRPDLESPGKDIYYHHGLDVGGSEGQTIVNSPVDGLVLSSADVTLHDYRRNTPVAPRYDVIYLLDARGWIYRHSHFYSISPEIKPGRRVKQGQFLGFLGKEGASGGWSHFHFDISSRQPSGKFGSEDGYPFYWQSYFTANPRPVQAVARPHRIALVGEDVLLDGSRSLRPGKINAELDYQWILSNGTLREGMIAYKKYGKPGLYSEILKVTDEDGNSDYDFCPVLIAASGKPRQEQPHTIHAAFHPTIGLVPGREIVFKVRSFGIDPLDGHEIWDFGDGSDRVAVCSDGNANIYNPEGYAVATHAYEKPGCYLVSVSRTSKLGYTATARLKVVVEE